MRTNSAAILLFLTMTACDSKPPTPIEKVPLEMTCGGEPCEHVAFMKKTNLPPLASNPPSTLKLSSTEHKSLNAALADTPSGDPNNGAHIHADAVSGRLVFSSDNGSHLVGNEPEISLSRGGPAKKVVATPAASELLQKRAGQ